MLTHLYIKNYALIEVLDIDFKEGFSVITGETGAGKSIILGALGLLLGQRADSKSLKSDKEKCTIEAHFDLSKYDIAEWFEENDLEADINDTIIRRELTPQGKSRGFINDSPVTLAQMKELGEMLIDIHSQHQNLLLQKQDFQLNVVDILSLNDKCLKQYREVYKEYAQARRELEELKRQISESRDNEEFMRFQLNELSSASLSSGEQEELEEEQETITHTEDIKTALFEADAMLNNEGAALDAVRTASNRLSSLTDIYPKISDVSERMSSLYIELKDVASEVQSMAEDVEFDPARLTFIQTRLDTIYSLERKFHVDSIDELLQEQERLQTIIDNIDNSDGNLADMEKHVAKLLADAQEKADKLTALRTKTAKGIEKDICQRLAALGMPNVVFKVDITKEDLTSNGQDKVSFLFSANKGMQLRPVSQVASGGEIARVMLSLKAMISGAIKLPTIIFDEIDTGVSGRVAEKMADIMHEMGQQGRQVISITHLPQIAAFGSMHYRVEKNDTEKGTTSVMRILTQEERIDEIAQMLSGSDITEAARTNAKALLNI